jgi:hypothetical protein
LGLRGHDLVGGHAELAQGHRVHVNVHADPAARRRFARRTDQSGSPEVLDAHHVAAVQQREAGFDQSLLLVGVADLHAGPLRLIDGGGAVFPRESGRGENRHPADAVAPGARTEQDREIAHPRGHPEHQALLRQRAHAQHVHQRVRRVAVVKGEFSANGGHAHRVAVPRDPRHHSFDQPALTSVTEFAKEERVHHGEWPSTHGEHVAQDAAHAGGGSLVGLDGRGVVVAFNTYGDRDVVPGVDDSGVFARPDQHVRAGRGQAA